MYVTTSNSWLDFGGETDRVADRGILNGILRLQECGNCKNLSSASGSIANDYNARGLWAAFGGCLLSLSTLLYIDLPLVM